MADAAPLGHCHSCPGEWAHCGQGGWAGRSATNGPGPLFCFGRVLGSMDQSALTGLVPLTVAERGRWPIVITDVRRTVVGTGHIVVVVMLFIFSREQSVGLSVAAGGAFADRGLGEPAAVV